MQNGAAVPSPRLDPQMAEAMKRMAEIAAGSPDRFAVSPDLARRLTEEQRRPWNANPPPMAEVEDVTIPGPFGDVPVRFLRPHGGRPAPAVVYLHGGGWVLGSLETHDKIMRLLAAKSGWTVVGVDYVLAPEHRFPDPVIECEAVFRHLSRNAGRYGLEPTAMALAGDSAGANLAVAATLGLGDRDGLRPAALVLFYGVFGSDLDTESYLTLGNGEFGLTRAQMDYFWAAYQRRPADREDPRAAPVKGQLGGLPPVHLMAAGLDPLRDDTLQFHSALEAAGVPCELLVEEGVCHGFLGLSDVVGKADHALDAAAAFLTRLG